MPATMPEPFYELGQQFAIDLPGARAMFTTRRGGFSLGPYESLNLGKMTDDDPAAVERNRDSLESSLHLQLGFVRQVHGPRVCELSPETATANRRAGPDGMTRADGQYTVERGLAPTALTADCLSIAVGGPGAVAMLHGGWRGLAAGVIAAGVQGLREAGADGELSAAIGPGAGGCCYEVGTEVHEAFSHLPDHVHRGDNLDLPAVARVELQRAGVTHIHDIGMCTICSDPELFFSHRRDRGVTGRQAGIAWLIA